MSTETQSTASIAEAFQAGYRLAGGEGDLTWPLPTADVIRMYRQLQWHVTPRIIELLWGSLPESWTPDDAHRLGVLLEKNGFWFRYPSVHDHRKPASQLAIEMTDFLEKATPAERMEHVNALPIETLLTVLAAAVDEGAQQMLLTSCLIKVEKLPPWSDSE